MPTESIQDLCHKPINEMSLEGLGYILLERFSEEKPPVNVYSLLMRLRGNTNSEIQNTRFNIMSEAVQWLRNNGLLMKSLGNQVEYLITRKGYEYLKPRNP